MPEAAEQARGADDVREALHSGRREYPLESWDVYGTVYRNAVPERVRGAREARSMTRRQLAEPVGVSENWIARVESGMRDLMGSDLVVVAEALGMVVADLVDMRVDAARLARCRDEAGLSRVELAVAVGRPRQWIERLEAEGGQIAAEDLFRVAQVLQVPVSELTAAGSTSPEALEWPVGAARAV